METVLYNFTGGAADGAGTGYGDLFFDQAGNIYGTTEEGGTKICNDENDTCGLVFEMSPSGGGWTEKALYIFSQAVTEDFL